jgi:hypothetical protein
MKKIKIGCLIAIFFGATSLPALAGEYDGSKALICSITAVVECGPGGNCQKLTAEDVGLPDFLKIDFKEKTISAPQASGEKRSSKIESFQRIDGKAIIQGAENGLEDVRDGVGWSLAVMEETGKMVLTASGDEVGFVLFGACTPY